MPEQVHSDGAGEDAGNQAQKSSRNIDNQKLTNRIDSQLGMMTRQIIVLDMQLENSEAEVARLNRVVAALQPNQGQA